VTSMKRVVLAMSGGVDSSVAALLLKRQGYEVIGLFMRTGVHGPADDTRHEHKKGCCSAVDAGDARRVADRLDVPFYALDFESDFGRIMDYFADEYGRGRTPNPCVVCNNWLKFGKLWSYGKQVGADFIATGHYVRRVEDAGQVALQRAADAHKDQTYVLFGLKRSILPHVLFPIGDLRKDEVRTLAREAGLGVAEKPDSVEICFVPDNDHFEFIRGRQRETTAGVIRDTAGKVLAEHDGIERFTIGQRKGMGFGGGRRRYVLEIVPDSGDVIVGDREELLAPRLRASRVNWLIERPTGPIECAAKIRYASTPAAAVVTPLDGDEVRVDFEEAQTAITPGQAVVFYAGDRLLGGAWIEEAIRA
jgi:tRNA-uridine 2-sulfurtransferase